MKQIIITLLLLAASIGGYSQNRANLSFELPALPDTLRSSEARFHFVVKNYWCNFNFKERAYIGSRVAEEALVNYIDLLLRMPIEESGKHLTDFLEKTAVEIEMQRYMNMLLRRYLVNYDSPMRNEILYICAAEYLSEKALDEVERYNAIQDTTLLGINQPGSISPDFTFILPTGEKQQLHDINGKDYTILLFYNPDCRSCSKILDAAQNSEIINEALAMGKIDFLAINAYDHTDIWRDFIKKTPEKWINGYDKGMKIISEGLYDLRALPIFYLLDSKKKIILKDVPFKQIEELIQ